MEYRWSDFDKFTKIDEYLPQRGEGESIATQASTAISKLVYKWFNDGDVYDNNYWSKGWCNDLSTYANWLYWHIEGANKILNKIRIIKTDEEYTSLLYDLCELVENLDWIELDKKAKEGSVYEEQEPFHFSEENDEEDW